MTDEIRAAGAVVWRPSDSGDGDGQIVLVHRPKYDDWSLPKGKLEPGEHVLLAAVREVAEETALRVALGRRLPPVHYQATGVPKRVDYWVATAEEPAGAFVPNAEIDGLAWVRAEAAARGPAAASPGTPLGSAAPTYPRDADTVAAALASPRGTTPLILVRHASAGHKSDWHGDDLSRPLDSEGDRDARSLAPLLRCFGVSRVVSAPAERCRATVRPYAALTGGTVEVEPALDVVGAHHGGSQPAGLRAGGRRPRRPSRRPPRRSSSAPTGRICRPCWPPRAPSLARRHPPGSRCAREGSWSCTGRPAGWPQPSGTTRTGSSPTVRVRREPVCEPRCCAAALLRHRVTGQAGLSIRCQSSVGGSEPSRMSSQRFTSIPAPPL